MYKIDLEQFKKYILNFPETYIEEDIIQELINGGDVFVDNIFSPHIYIMGGSILFPGAGSHIFIYGDINVDSYNNDFISFIQQRNKKEKVYLYLFSNNFEQKCNKLFGNKIIERWNRLTFRLNKKLFNEHINWRANIPNGYSIVNFDGSSDEFLLKYGKTKDFWNIESKRFGRVLIKNDIDTIVCECFSVFISGKMVEIGIDTKEEYRKKGFGFLTSMAFIEYALSCGLEPNWGCWTFNIESIALAKKLGFLERSNIKMLSIDINSI
jgi:RimJ/RimL family protein N-acetyltransferase